jgi:hypothetical protein
LVEEIIAATEKRTIKINLALSEMSLSSIKTYPKYKARK